MPDFTNLQSVEKLVFRGCKRLVEVHKSIGRLTNLSHLDLGECDHLKKLTESIGQLTKLGHLDLYRCVNLKRLPEAIIQLTTLSSLNLGGCYNLARLPEQLGDMKCLKMLDASYTSIEQLPDSIGYLKELIELKLYKCKKLRKVPEQIGNMESLKLFNASSSAIEHLPNTFGGLINLDELDLSYCKNLTSLPNTLWNLTSLAKLYLEQEDMVKIDLPDMVKDMKLKTLNMTCDVSLWLPVILSLSTLENLNLGCESQSFSPNGPYSLSKLSNLRRLTLVNKISHECPFPELPLNLTELRISEYKTLEMLLDLSSLKQLKFLRLWRCISLQSIPPLPPHLEELDLHECTSLQDLRDLSILKECRRLKLRDCINLKSIPPLPPHLEELDLYECTSLRDLPDLSILKELRRLELTDCINLKSNSLKQSILQVGQHKLNSFEAYIPNKEVAEWFSYKSSGNTLSFTIPPNSGDNFFGFGLWIVYKCNFLSSSLSLPHLRAVITNRTKDIKIEMYHILWYNRGEVQSRVHVQCIRGGMLSMESGDRIKISVIPSGGRIKVKKCGAHVMGRKHC